MLLVNDYAHKLPPSLTIVNTFLYELQGIFTIVIDNEIRER